MTSSGNTLFIDMKIIDVVRIVEPVMLSPVPSFVYSTLLGWSRALRLSYLSETTDLLKTTSTFWSTPYAQYSRLFCADAVNSRDGLSRRIEPEDEMMLDLWTIISRISPFDIFNPSDFSCSDIFFPDSCFPVVSSSNMSSTIPAKYPDIVRSLTQLEEAINREDTELAARAFDGLIQVEDVRTRIICYAIGISPGYYAACPAALIDLGSSYSNRMLRVEYTYEDYIMCASLGIDTLRQKLRARGAWGPYRNDNIFGRIAEAMQRTAWKHVPWAMVLDLTKLANYEDSDHTGISKKVDRIREQVITMDESIIAATRSRRLFTTQNGLMGMGPTTVSPGDCLCLLNGGRTPFILRLDGHMSSGEHYKNYAEVMIEWKNDRNMYTFIPDVIFKLTGDCYVHGFMDAETLDENIFRACGSMKTDSYNTMNREKLLQSRWAFYNGAAILLKGTQSPTWDTCRLE